MHRCCSLGPERRLAMHLQAQSTGKSSTEACADNNNSVRGLLLAVKSSEIFIRRHLKSKESRDTQDRFTEHDFQDFHEIHYEHVK